MKAKILLLIILFSNLSYGQGNGLYKFESENGKYGFIDKTGKIKIKAQYLITGDFNDGLCYVSKEVIKKDYKWIFIDTLGNVAFNIKDAFPESGFNDGFARISNFGEHWFVNKNGVNEFGKTWKDGHGNFKNGIAYVSDIKYSNFYPINTKGEKIDPKIISDIDTYNNSHSETDNKNEFRSSKFIPFIENELWGFKDELNNVIIEPKFYLVDKFENGICAVRINEQEFEIANDYFLDAIIDEQGKVLNRIEMHCYRGFQGEFIKFYGAPHFGGGVHYLNKSGQLVIPTE
ncbi:WG repeat-containing protein [Chryseobacterium balustinum]|uniref:KWG Leptospira n=1 Tax=Chryseobacterium balustinum TaxID=246 RepID=A0AAX2IL27_9FLAO|nr:WG repeat-containing protein [Chryseobacterium balustinum]AZB31649.1 WG repeat-containing protein [Chryseobacterium balustinum]SKB81559.1 WG containing repeat-containing protein [Chryseobacterium balustinum]SQA89913.1 KWG Leptospira [Chryseobacterium balustinum]